jgi:hypothetical protein
LNRPISAWNASNVLTETSGLLFGVVVRRPLVGSGVRVSKLPRIRIMVREQPERQWTPAMAVAVRGTLGRSPVPGANTCRPVTVAHVVRESIQGSVDRTLFEQPQHRALA